MIQALGSLAARIGVLLVTAAALAQLPINLGAAEAAEIEIHNLKLAGAPSPWRTVNSFSLDWRSSPPTTVTGPYAIDYLIRDSSATVVLPPTRVAVGGTELSGVRIPAAPGSAEASRGLYTIEIWAEGSHAPHAFATLGFDDEPPGAAQPKAPTAWIKAGASLTIEIEHPTAPLPASGIRGYAVAFDHGDGEEPCVDATRCNEAETDLDGGIGDDSFKVGPLDEGTNVVRVAAVSVAGIRSRQVESAVLRVDGSPPQLTFLGLPSGWANGPVHVVANASDPLSGVSPDGPEGPFTALTVDDGVATIAFGGSVATTVHGDGVHSLLAVARDAIGNAIDAARSDAPRAQVRIDESPPRLAFLPSRDPAEPERILASVADPLSGPAARGTIAVRPSGSSQRFEPLATVAGSGLLSALWDSDAYPPGNYEFRATGFDLAGNEASTKLGTDGAPLVLSNPLKTPVAIPFGFGGRQLIWHRCARQTVGVRCHRKVIVAFDRRPSQRTVPFGHGIPVSGRLTTASGVPLAGLEVEIDEAFAPGSSPRRRATTVVSGADGTFLARLEPGPSRQVRVGFAGNRQLTRAAGRELQLGVRARVGMHASAATAAIGGAPVAFKGKVVHQDAAIPATGLAVELQFQVLGSPWSEFRTVQTDPYGRFSYPYAFSDDDSRGIRFQFRAVVPEQTGWPYEPGVSRPVAVTGR